jgi:hypothetical protein
MKELCLVAAYTPDLERQDVLRRLITTLKNNDKKVLLITHSQTPSDIIERVDYHFYDHENEFLTDNKYKVWYGSSINQDMIVSQDVVKYSAALLPCTRNLWFGLQMGKMLGYGCVHYIEYDTEILDISVIDDNTALMTDYDGVYYTDDVEWQIRLPEYRSGSHLYGAYSVYNVNKYTYDDLIWDRQRLLDDYTNPGNSQLVEKVIEGILIKDRNFIVKNKKDLIENGLKPNLLNKGSNSKPIDPKIFFIQDNIVKLYALNAKTTVESIEIISNNSSLMTYTLEPGYYRISNIGAVGDVQNVKVYNDNEFVRGYDLSTQENIDKLIKYNHVRKMS